MPDKPHNDGRQEMNNLPSSSEVEIEVLEGGGPGEKRLQAPKTQNGEVPNKTPEEEIANLREQLSTTCKDLAKAVQDRIEADQNWLRGKADVDNIRKRAMKDVQRARQAAVEGFALSVLEIKDSLEFATSFKDKQHSQEQVQEGISLTLKKFEQLFAERNVKEIYPLNRPFDPLLHQAMTTLPRQKGQKMGYVVQVIQKGYVMGEQLLRPAMVAVASEESGQ